MRIPISSVPARFLAICLLAAWSLTAQADTSDLLGTLTNKLGITQEQAAGGAGAIFDYAKKNLSADDFSKIAGGIPGMDGLLSAAPAAEGGGSSMLSQAGNMLGGSAGGLASLAGAFESLGLDADMVSEFLPLVYDYVGGASGSEAMGLLKGLF